MFGNSFNPYAPSTPYYPNYPQNTGTNNVNWVYVNGMEGARNQIVQPNQVTWMMDNNDPMIYVKAVDGMGTATLKAFRLEEVNQNVQAASQDMFASRNDLAALATRIEAIEREIGGLNS